MKMFQILKNKIEKRKIEKDFKQMFKSIEELKERIILLNEKKETYSHFYQRFMRKM